MPGPSSDTAISTMPPWRRAAAIVIAPCSGANLSALSIRLPIACARSSGSPATVCTPAEQQVLDLLEHAVDRLREDVQLVRAAADRQPARQVAGDDRRGSLADAPHLGE